MLFLVSTAEKRFVVLQIKFHHGFIQNETNIISIKNPEKTQDSNVVIELHCQE